MGLINDLLNKYTLWSSGREGIKEGMQERKAILEQIAVLDAKMLRIQNDRNMDSRSQLKLLIPLQDQIDALNAEIGQ